MLLLEVLIGKLLTVDRLATSAVAASEVATLQHELGDDTVEGGALVVQRLARAASALLTSAESAEVLSSARSHIGEELENNSALRSATNGDIKENTRVLGHFET